MKKLNLPFKQFVCGSAAALISQGCLPDLRQLTEEENISILNEVQSGQETLQPVLEEIVEVADKEACFGFGGQSGREVFLKDLDLTQQRLDEILKERQLYAFNDPEYHGFAFFYDHDVGGNGGMAKKDFIAFNLSSLKFIDSSGFYDPNEPENMIDFGLLMHEASHEWTKHTDKTEDYVDSMASDDDLSEGERTQSLLIENRDFSYLLSISFEKLESFRNSGYLDAFKWLDLETRLEVAKSQIETYDSNDAYLENKKDYLARWEDFLDQLSTAEGFADLCVEDSVLSNNFISFFRDYWKISDEEFKRIIAESGWYEEYVEEDMREFVSEARRELGLEVVESEPISPEDELNTEFRGLIR